MNRVYCGARVSHCGFRRASQLVWSDRKMTVLRRHDNDSGAVDLVTTRCLPVMSGALGGWFELFGGGGGAAGGAGSAFGAKQWSGAAAMEVAGEEQRAAAAPDDPVGVAAFDGDAGAAVVEVAVFDVEGEHFAGAAGGFVEHAPEESF